MGIDNSAIQTFKDCPRRFRYQYLLCLSQKEDEESKHDVNFGSAIHAGLETWYKTWDKTLAINAFIKGYPTQLKESDYAKTQDNGVLALETYFEKYASDKERFKILSTEKVDSFDFGGSEIIVKMDLVVEDSGGIYGIDHKTTGGSYGLTEKYWSQYELSSQITKYYDFIEQKYGPCHGFIVNAIYFGHRFRAYKGEPAGAYCKMDRQTFNRTPQHIEQEKQDTKYWVQKIQEAKDLNYYAFNSSKCMFCSYQDVCKSGRAWEDDKDTILMDYQVIDPLEYLKK